MNRREFLGTAVGVTGLALHAGAAQTEAAAPSTPKPWRAGLGLNGFMSSEAEFHKTYPLWEVLDFAVAQGFEGIELVEGWPQGGYPRAAEHERVASLRGLYDRYALKVYTLQTGGPGAHSADADARAAWLADLDDKIALAKQLGCDFIGHWPGGGLEGNKDIDAAITTLAHSYREAAKRCADAGLYLSFEIEPPFIFNTLEHLTAILERADHPALKTNYDPSHFDVMSGSTGKPEDMLRAVGVEHIGHVHLTDTDGTQFGGTSRHLAAGEGHCDLGRSMELLRSGGYTGWVMIDAWKIEDAYNAAAKGKALIDQYNR